MDLQTKIDTVVTRIQSLTSEITICDLERQGDIVLELDALKKALKGGLQCINKVYDKASEHLCRSIADELEDVTYRHPKATITASARGFFTIEDPEAFVEWYNKKFEGNGLGKVFELYKSKKAMSEFFEENVLKNGEPLPKCVKSHVIAKCNIRRK